MCIEFDEETQDECCFDDDGGHFQQCADACSEEWTAGRYIHMSITWQYIASRHTSALMTLRSYTHVIHSLGMFIRNPSCDSTSQWFEYILIHQHMPWHAQHTSTQYHRCVSRVLMRDAYPQRIQACRHTSSMHPHMVVWLYPVV